MSSHRVSIASHHPQDDKRWSDKGEKVYRRQTRSRPRLATSFSGDTTSTCARPVTSKPQITVLSLGKPGVCRLGPSAVGGAPLELRPVPGKAHRGCVICMSITYIPPQAVTLVDGSAKPGAMPGDVLRIGKPRRLQNLLFWHRHKLKNTTI